VIDNGTNVPSTGHDVAVRERPARIAGHQRHARLSARIGDHGHAGQQHGGWEACNRDKFHAREFNGTIDCARISGPSGNPSPKRDIGAFEVQQDGVVFDTDFEDCVP
jgi:hypothetical protein